MHIRLQFKRINEEIDSLQSAVALLEAASAAPSEGVEGGVTNGNDHDHSGGDGAQIAYSSLSGTPTLGTAAAAASTDFAVAAKGVTNGDSHDHSGGDGAQIAYSSLSGRPTLGTAAAAATGDFEASGAIATHAASAFAHGASRIETYSGADPGSPVTGQIWLRTDL